MPLITELEIPNEFYKFKEKEKELKVLKNLSKVNILIGANNNGKSRFLRALFYNELNFKPNNDDIKNINEKLSYLRSNFLVDESLKIEYDFYFDKYFQNIEFLRTNTYLGVNNVLGSLEKEFENFREMIEIMEEGEDLELSEQRGYDSVRYLLNSLKESIGGMQMIYPFKGCYIPILRGLRPINYTQSDYEENAHINADDSYAKRTVQDYFPKMESLPELGERYYIFTGLRTYEYFRDYKGSEEDKKRDAISEYEKFLSENFFNYQNVEIVPINPNNENKKRNVVKIRIGNEEGKMIYELGDGIQSIIIMTLPLFLYKGIINENENVLVFIEEPEQHIHPGLQRKLLETFINYEGFDKFQFFITTHSNHFLDIPFDWNKISVFSFNKKCNEEGKPNFTIENRSVNDTDVLELLGTRTIATFSNCMIFIEGFTDRYYLKKYFEIYQTEKIKEGYMEFHEDYHYSFFEYHGSNISNSFLLKEEDYYSENTLRLKKSVFVLMDGDKTGKPEAETLKSTLGKRFSLLSCKEIENLVSKRILIKYLTEIKGYTENDLKDFEESDYQKLDCKMGDFIKEKVVKSSAMNFQMNKNNFCHDIINLLENMDDLSDLAKNLCKDLYEFIENQNN